MEIQESEKRKWLIHIDGKLYFSKKAERTLFFILTMIMLILGLWVKAGF